LCPVIAMISLVEQPASASRRAAAFFRPCGTQRCGNPASRIASETMFPKTSMRQIGKASNDDDLATAALSRPKSDTEALAKVTPATREVGGNLNAENLLTV
jgi:hypothetical protein